MRELRQVMRLTIRLVAAQVMSDSQCWMSRSSSRTCRHACKTQACERSTAQRRGRTTNPEASFGRLTVLIVRFRQVVAQVTSCPTQAESAQTKLISGCISRSRNSTSLAALRSVMSAR